MIDIRNNAKWQNTSKVENDIAGCILASRGILVKIYVNYKYKEQRKVAEI